MKTPIAFLIFNRPDTTKKVFEAIRQVQPPKLLVVADGPRQDRQNEAETCVAVRAIIDQVDWNCEVLTNYSDINLGCKERVSSGLDWIFNTVEEAIILEDDCVPHPTFFQFCEQLLERYRYDARIMSICGLNIQFGRQRSRYSYYFSHYSHIWGWATWRRAWQYYDVNMKIWPEIRDDNLLKNVLSHPHVIRYWTKIFQATYEKRIDTWDYQWIFACLIHSGLCVVPQINLVTNLGFGTGATHTVNDSDSSQYSNLKVGAVSFPLEHPSYIIRNVTADDFMQDTYYNMIWLEQLKWKLRRFGKLKPRTYF